MFDWDKEIEFSTTPPKRTDGGEGNADKKYVYVISHKNYPGEYKVGIAKDWSSRLSSYQTSDPNRAYKLEYKLLTETYREIEKHIHNCFDNKHEWVTGVLSDIINEIDDYAKQN